MFDSEELLQFFRNHLLLENLEFNGEIDPEIICPFINENLKNLKTFKIRIYLSLN